MDFKEAEQTEKAYQKQDAIFIGRKNIIENKIAIIISNLFEGCKLILKSSKKPIKNIEKLKKI